jgi:hypothetical protein
MIRAQERNELMMECSDFRDRKSPETAIVRLGSALLLGASMFAVSHMAEGDELQSAVETSLEHTDNVDLTPEKTSDFIATAFWNFDYSEEGRDLSAKASGQLGYRHYINGKAEDEFVPNFLTSVLWHISPQHFDWSFEAVGRQIKQDSLGPDAPDNRENQFSVLTGPNFLARLDSRSSLEARARYGYGLFSESSGDDRQLFLGQVALRFRQSPSVTWSPTLGAARMDFTEETLNSDFNIANAYLRYEVMSGTLSTLSLDVGASMLERENEPGLTGTLFRLEVGRQLLADSRVQLTLLQEFTDDVLTSLREGVDIAETTPRDSLASSPYKDQLARLSYEFEKTNLGGGITIYGRRKDFDEPTDESQYGGTLSLNYRLSPVSVASVVARYYRSEYEEMDTRDNTYELSIGYSKALGRSFLARGQVSHQRRSSDLEVDEYQESAIGISLTIGRNTVGGR